MLKMLCQKDKTFLFQIQMRSESGEELQKNQWEN